MKKKILIVEDEAIIAADLARIINKNTCWEALESCDSVKEALKSIALHLPDLVLIDINLRGPENGTLIGSYLLKQDKIPFIFITSLSDSLTLEDVKRTRPMGYILKPFKQQIISSTIEIVLANHKHRKLDPVRHIEEPQSDIPFRLRKVTDYISDNLDKKLVVQKLAEMTDWKLHHFIRLFKTYVGSTPYQYILEQKINRSKSLLKETDFPISMIAYDLGFQTHSNFSVTFQKSMKMSAEDFRRKAKISAEM